MLSRLKTYTGLTIAFVLFAAATAFPAIGRAAGDATLKLSPASSGSTVGSTLSAIIDVDSGSSQFNTVQAMLKYEPSKLQYVSTSFSGTVFAQGDNPHSSTKIGSNQIKVRAGVTGSVGGKQKLATVSFKVLSAGPATITFVKDSDPEVGSSIIAVPSFTNIWNESTSGGTYTLKAAPSGGSNNDDDKNNTDNNTPTKPTDSNNGAPKNPQVADDEPVPVEVDGISLEGYLVAIQIFDNNKLGVPNTTVKLDDREVATDKYGIASFIGVVAGEHTVSVDGLTQTITVTEGDKTTVQNFSITKPNKRSTSKLLVYGATVLVVVLLASGYLYVASFLKNRRPGPPTTPSGGSSNTGSSGSGENQPDIPKHTLAMPELPKPGMVFPNEGTRVSPKVTGDNAKSLSSE